MRCAMAMLTRVQCPSRTSATVRVDVQPGGQAVRGPSPLSQPAQVPRCLGRVGDRTAGSAPARRHDC